jgi:hypothetical protein
MKTKQALHQLDGLDDMNDTLAKARGSPPVQALISAPVTHLAAAKPDTISVTFFVLIRNTQYILLQGQD